MKAREFLAQKGQETALRNLVKEPLTVAELKALAKRVDGGVRELVAPKRRAEAEDLPDGELYEWLAADGGRLRRPIIDLGGAKVALGFTGAVRDELEGKL